ncbi:MAG TPA: hemolysin D [Pirellulaceae bacterium]|nr:hemolysin D [Pirellulaceae bacterium]
MATLADSLVSSASRRLTLRMRADLSARKQRYHGCAYWVVKEPVGLNYYRFHEEEYAILCMLDGNSSLEQIKEQFEEEFTPQKITFSDLQQFVGMLHRSGLVVSEAAGQGRQLKRRRDEKKRKELMGKFTNIFAIRFRGFDPERILNWLHPFFGWLFHPLTVMFFTMLGLSALSLLLVQFDVFRTRLPTFHEFFGPHNWIYLGVTMGTVKVLHEFGHGLSCKYYGGECHEIGIMLLVFTPCLYCNVSDSWMLPSKWKRAFIGAAGMYVELILATFATFIWWFSEPGLLNHLALSMMFICSVSTVMFNANPLLRFDGYYITMDLAEIPNLRQKSTEVLKRFMVKTCLGIEQPPSPFLPQRRQVFFAMFTIASVMYRWVVVFSIMYFLTKVLEPYGLRIIGELVAVAGLFGLVVQPLIRLTKFFYMPGRMHKVKRHRVVATAAVVVALLVGVLLIPLPFHVACTFEVSPRGAEQVYPGVSGLFNGALVKPGDAVIKDETVLARLENIDLLLAVEQLRGERERLDAQLVNVTRQSFLNPAISSQTETLEKMIDTVERQLAEKEKEASLLEIIAPVSGVVFPPPVRPFRDSGDGRLPSWSGSLFDKKNRGASLQERDQLCQIGDASAFEAVLVVDQGDVNLVLEYHGKNNRQWPAVDMKLDAYRWQTFSGEIEKVALAPMEHTSASLASQGGGELDAKTEANGMLKPISTSYQARVRFDDNDEQLRVGLTGQAKIYTGWQPIGRRVARYLYRTFRFNW